DGSIGSAAATGEISMGSGDAKEFAAARLIGGNRLLGLFTSRKTPIDGDVSVMRFNGVSVDNGFGKRGAVAINDTGPLAGTPLQVIPQADGKSLILAKLDMYEYYPSRYVLLRIKSDGALDGLFGKGGQLRLPNPDPGRYGALEVDSAGKI